MKPNKYFYTQKNGEKHSFRQKTFAFKTNKIVRKSEKIIGTRTESFCRLKTVERFSICILKKSYENILSTFSKQRSKLLIMMILKSSFSEHVLNIW